MFLKNLQLTRNSLTTLVLLMSQASLISKSYSLDLKVDLPQNAGKEPVLYYNPIVNQQADSSFSKGTTAKEPEVSKKKQKASKSDQVEKSVPKEEIVLADDGGLEVPPAPKSISQKKKEIALESNGKKNSIKSRKMREDTVALEEDNNDSVQLVRSTSALNNSKDPFPMLACIEDNVAFWERVYTEIDVNEAYLHDKNDLSRIYSTLSLPTNKSQRSRYIDNERKKYINIINNLAAKLKTPRKNWTKEEKRVAALFKESGLTLKNLNEAKSNMRIQTGLKSQFEAGVQRSINYLPSVFPIVKKSGLPIDLAYLPHVESSYNSKAGSKVGAMGLWQIMPGTMRIVEGHAAVSKRTDPKIATTAAMKILKSDFDKVQNWPLTLTAYNHGVNGMLRAIDETGSRDLCKVIDHYSSPSFRFASSNFYAQFLAARKAAKQRYSQLAKKGKGGSGVVLRRTILSSQGGSLK
ncbi:transglycosylase SLT domain-containing protein [Silvanigrella paludirubra]|uniref:Transglycosylase SLT domain-containing protein n=1 Tax=Silvanigrella paludirubra TaxID=2499159 RepID=A0A6N6VRQ8_9BACT|nr:lytic transglycosylase domain-containing protein [Silvanigrella paludirubra]KAB8038072.1 transglycosylase SLT domain-containing protein [Silvanigrella paludirubra]